MAQNRTGATDRGELARPETGPIKVGVAGWAREDWRGRVYPPDKRDRLSYLHRIKRVDLLDLDESRRAPLAPGYYEDLLDRADERIEFIVRAPFSLTGKVYDSSGAFIRAESAMREFNESLRPFHGARGRLRAALIELPIKFRRAPGATDHLKWLVGAIRLPRGASVALKLTDKSWRRPSTLDLARDLGAEIALIDQPPIAGGAWLDPIALNGHALIWLMGRSDRWYGAPGAARYDYSYSSDEARELLHVALEAMKIADKVSLIFANATEGKNVGDALFFRDLIESNLPRHASRVDAKGKEKPSDER